MQLQYLGNTGLRVSELALGTVTFGDDLEWSADEATCRDIFAEYVDAGGNFVDTADVYTGGQSERILGDLLAEYGRDRFVVASKYTLTRRQADPNASGNGRKNLFASIEASLNRLDTDYLDLLYVHAWDRATPLEEVLRGLDDLVSQGKVHHVGFSDVPAWVLSRAHTMAQERDWPPFAAMQCKYNLLERTPERELLPMVDALDIGVTAWSPLHEGVLTGKYLDSDAETTSRDRPLGERETEVARTVESVAADLDVTPAQVAIAWVHQQGRIPIVGATDPAHVRESLGCLSVDLSEDHLARLDEATAIERGFPHDFLDLPRMQQTIYGPEEDRLDRPDERV